MATHDGIHASTIPDTSVTVIPLTEEEEFVLVSETVLIELGFPATDLEVVV
jgi:hypothetical protein